jgi:CVNH domain/CHAT domain
MRCSSGDRFFDIWNLWLENAATATLDGFTFYGDSLTLMKILFLSANPPGTARLDLDKEVSKIEDGLKRSKLRDRFGLVSKWAVDSQDLRRALLEENPDIVHFSGHGEGQTGLVLVGQDGKPKPATAEALCGLFEQFPNIKCVLLNACYAEVQAKAIVRHIDFVIGMKQAVRDDAAIAFATGFYDGLGYGKSIDVAFALGCNAIQFELASFSATTRSRKFIPVDFEKVEPLSDHLIPVLLKKETGLTGSSTNPNLSSFGATSLSEKLRSNNDISKTDALQTYRGRVQEFLADLKLTQIEKFQLAILANVLGVSEADANRILQEEQEKQQDTARYVTTSQSQFTKIGNVRNYLFGGVAALLIGLGGFLTYRQIISIDLNYNQIPSGGYQDSCKDIIVDNGILKATCLTRDGQYKSTDLLKFNDCANITNDNGSLECQTPELYRKSCKDIRVENGVLRASCAKDNGQYKSTELSNFKNCKLIDNRPLAK